MMGPHIRLHSIWLLLCACLLLFASSLFAGDQKEIFCISHKPLSSPMAGIDSMPVPSRENNLYSKSELHPTTSTSISDATAEDQTKAPISPDKANLTLSEPQPKPQAYVDQLIDEGVAEDEFEDIDPATGLAGWTGIDFLSLTGRVYNSHSNRNGTLTEYGTQLVGRKETIDNGSFEWQVDGLSSHDQQDQRQEGGRFLLRQSHLVISNTWQMDNEVGHIRSQTPRPISASYRFHLPSSLLQGLGTTLYNDNTTLSLCVGDIGGLSGIASREFNTTQGNLQGVSLTHEFNAQWFAGAQFWDTNELQEVDDHQSVAGVLQYQDLDQTQNHQLHLLADSQSNTGLWYDAAIRLNRWSHNLGIFYIQPDLLWTDVAINNDQEGFYWRGNRRSFRWQWTLGTEVSNDHLDKDPYLPRYLSTHSFANGSWRLRRDTLLGAAFTLNTKHADSGTAQGDNSGYSLKSFVNHRFPIGMTRCQASLSIKDTQEADSTQYGLLWDQVWDIPFVRRLNTDIEYLSNEDESDEISMRLAVEKSIGSNLWFSAAAQYIHILEQDHGQGDASNASIAINWQLNRNWKLSLSADQSRNRFETIDSVDTTTESQSMLLSFSYALSGPRRQPPTLGRRTSSIGHGGISGRVFLDENQNGRYDLNETPIKDIVVILDGRFQTETDANGRFDYWPVAAGDHFVMIGVEDVPLPWGLEDDKPQKVFVSVRSQGIVDFALIKLNE